MKKEDFLKSLEQKENEYYWYILTIKYRPTVFKLMIDQMKTLSEKIFIQKKQTQGFIVRANFLI